MDTFKLTSRSTIRDIAEEIAYQFGVDEKEAREAARAVKKAHKTGSILWTAQRLTTTDSSALNYQVR